MAGSYRGSRTERCAIPWTVTLANGRTLSLTAADSEPVVLALFARSGDLSAADSNRGGFDEAFRQASVRVEQTYRTPREHHNPLEPHATVAVWHGPDRLTLYDGTQGVFVSTSSAEARLLADGTALVRAGSQDLGTGTYTVMTQVAADALGLPVSSVRFDLGDTALPEAPLSAGSRTAASVGSAVRLAGVEVRRRLAVLAAETPSSPLYGTKPDRLDAADGVLFDRDDSRRRQSYADVLKSAQKKNLFAVVESKEKPERKNFATHAFGAQFAAVVVDEELGDVRVRRMVGAFGAGQVLNAKTARSQSLGGMVWAIGFALQEHTVRDARSGRVVTRDLADYHVPVHADVPALDALLVEEDESHVSEVGAKGVGEIGITGGVAAIANAVYHATGRRVRDLPTTIDNC
jgi:xanthine dehydrogenase YagR molybdenum-binding subunit